MAESEVARLRRQIELELEAMQYAMKGAAFGTARHDFIMKRMDQIGNYQEELAEYVGDSAAVQVVYTLYDAAMQ